MSASEGAAPDDQLNSERRQISKPPEIVSSSGGADRDDVENADPEMFVTPTSTPHRIPPPTTCPPPPTKPRPVKRRSYVAGVNIRPLHLTMEEIASAWQTRSGRQLAYRRIWLWKSGRCMRFLGFP